MATLVHLCRHGQVENPDHVLYGRQPNWHLSELGQQMAARLGEHFSDAELTHLRCSPLERAQETMAPIAAAHQELSITLDDNLLEATNRFEGTTFGLNRQTLLNPRALWWLRNPMTPSWGEPFTEVAERMNQAIVDAAYAAGDGGQALIVSHQLPIWVARLTAQGRSFLHDPRNRECALASVTTLKVADGRISFVSYEAPCIDLLDDRSPISGTKFKAGS
ncbi:MAG: histidine phosphatase family protein [Propionibacteriaceae bacterium]